jgi:hypothetical protein
MDSKFIPTAFAIETPLSTIVMPDEQYAVSQLRILRKKAEKSGREIAKELHMWKDSLGQGKFKKNYLLAGWTESRVQHYLTYYQQDAALYTGPEVVENKETPVDPQEPPIAVGLQVVDLKEPKSSISWFVHRLENVMDTLTQILAEEKWRKDEKFPELQQVGAKLMNLLEKL